MPFKTKTHLCQRDLFCIYTCKCHFQTGVETSALTSLKRSRMEGQLPLGVCGVRVVHHNLKQVKRIIWSLTSESPKSPSTAEKSSKELWISEVLSPSKLLQVSNGKQSPFSFFPTEQTSRVAVNFTTVRLPTSSHWDVDAPLLWCVTCAACLKTVTWCTWNKHLQIVLRATGRTYLGNSAVTGVMRMSR